MLTPVNIRVGSVISVFPINIRRLRFKIVIVKILVFKRAVQPELSLMKSSRKL